MGKPFLRDAPACGTGVAGLCGRAQVSPEGDSLNCQLTNPPGDGTQRNRWDPWLGKPSNRSFLVAAGGDTRGSCERCLALLINKPFPGTSQLQLVSGPGAGCIPALPGSSIPGRDGGADRRCNAQTPRISTAPSSGTTPETPRECGAFLPLLLLAGKAPSLVLCGDAPCRSPKLPLEPSAQSEAREGRVISCQSNYSLFSQIILGEFECGHFSCSCGSSEDCAAVVCEFLSLISALLSLPLISMRSGLCAEPCLCSREPLHSSQELSWLLTGLSSRSKVPKPCHEPGMCSKTFSDFFIKQEIASILPFRVFPGMFALLALAVELCTQAGTWHCWTWAWHVLSELWCSWELENQDFEGRWGQPRAFVGPEESFQWQERERWDCGGWQRGPSPPKTPQAAAAPEVAAAPFPAPSHLHLLQTSGQTTLLLPGICSGPLFLWTGLSAAWGV